MATADERIAEQRAEQEARSTELMLEQSQLQDQINEKKKGCIHLITQR